MAQGKGKGPPKGKSTRGGSSSARKTTSRKTTSRKTTARKTTARKTTSRRKKPSASASRRKASAAPSWPRRILRWAVRISVAVVIAGLLGSAVVGFALYRQALGQVRDRLASNIWDLPGKVWSGPVEVWPGMVMTADELAQDLQGAGYARVKQATRPGDFAARTDMVVVNNRASTGPGWDIPEEEGILVTFKDGRVSSTTPIEPAVFPPTVLASIRGSDNEERTPRSLEDFPQALRRGVLAMEDANFYTHRGVSPLGIARALFVNVTAGQTVQGGSTLTQQLAKNLFLSSERTLSRKGHEMLLAFALERELTKDEILSLYLNEIYWGQAGGAAICGADEAARAYFGKPVERLTLSEAATLAGVISSPNTYSPLRHLERAQKRRDLALDRMVAEGWLDASLAEKTKSTELRVVPGVTGRKAPYAVDAAVDAAEKALGEGIVAEEGLNIHTMINPGLQRHAEAMVELSMAKLDDAWPHAKGAQIALVAVRVEDGAVVALVGGRDYASSQFNRATLAERQPGSTVKPLTALFAMEEDKALSPATRFDDAPLIRTLDGKTWSPTNYDGTYLGEIPLRQVIAKSRNVPSVLLAEALGYGDLQTGLQKVGLDGATRLPSVSLGAFSATPMDMAGAYTVFPGGGVYAEPRLLRAVSDSEGKLLVNDEPITLRRASARAAHMATSMLESVVSEGTGVRVRTFGATGTVAGKTGTTDNYRDAWFVGFTPELSVAVWVGFDDNRSTGLSGSKAAIPTWARFIAGTGSTRSAFPTSPNVIEADACVGGWEAGLCLECETELFSRSAVPERGCEGDFLAEIFENIRKGPSDSSGKKPGSGQKKAKKRKWFWSF